MIPTLPQGSKGFTLIEVLIAVALLALMSIAIVQVTSRSFDLNFKLGSETSDYTGILLSLQTVERDLSQIYSPVTGPTKAPDPTQNESPSEFWSIPVRSDGTRRARLKGNKEKLSFITNSNLRLEADSPQSDFLRVTWEIKRNKEGSYSLLRSTEWDVFRLDPNSDRKPVEVALIENISSAKFTYYRPENKAWQEEWDSESPYSKDQNRFPALISLKITVPDPINNQQQLDWEVISKPLMPLNGFLKKPPTPPKAPGAAAAPAERNESEAPPAE